MAKLIESHDVKWTKTKRARYLKSKGIRCPDCDSDALIACPVELDENPAGKVSCGACGATWTDVYKLIDVL